MTGPFGVRLLGRALITILAALASPSIFSCGSDPDSPEAQVRALLARAEVAAEEKDLTALKPLISAGYADERGHDKRAIEGLLRYYFLRNRSIHLLTQVQAIAFPELRRAEVTVFVAMAGLPISAVEELGRLRADLHRFDIDLAKEGGGDWKVIRAEWRRAEMEDFL